MACNCIDGPDSDEHRALVARVNASHLEDGHRWQERTRRTAQSLRRRAEAHELLDALPEQRQELLP